MNILVIGAGPAGLAAAAAALEGGADVTVLDASDVPGGQYWRHLPPHRPVASESVLHHHWDRFTELRDATAAATRLSAQVWAIEATGNGPRVRVALGDADADHRDQLTIEPDALVLATGAHDRALPVPGWTLPGVYTAGAAQAMAKGERIALGSRVVVSGAGPFLLPVTRSLAQAGARVLGIFEASGLPGLITGWGRRPWELAAAGGKLTELVGYVSHLVGARTGYHLGQQVVAVHGTDSVEAVTVATLDSRWRVIPGTERRIECDAVCLGHGFTPRLELAIAAGCRLTADRQVLTDPAQATSVAGVWAAGELTALGGVDHALASGRVAGWTAAGGDLTDPAIAAARKAAVRFARFAGRIEAAHGIRDGWTSWLTPDTTICRCEEVSHADLTDRLTTTQPQGLRSAKLTSRAGLGLCQGRICGRTLETLLAASRGHADTADQAIIDRRPIAAPITLGDLARTTNSPAPSRPGPDPKGRT